MDPAAIQQLVQAAVQAALQAVQAAAAPNPPAAPPFAEAPAGPANAAPWDYTTPEGRKVYAKATAPLEKLYDGKSATLKHFLRAVNQRAIHSGWNQILHVPDAQNVVRSITTHYGMLTVADVSTHALTYMNAQGRDQQASVQLAQFILNSLEPAKVDELELRRSQYTINVAAANQPVVMKESGALMLCALIGMVNVEMRTTVFNLTATLNNLPALMEECKGDVRAFNLRVDETMSMLRARNATVPDILVGLFSAYAVTSDATFTAYMDKKLDNYQDRTLDITVDQLMLTALEKYKVLVDAGRWNKKSTMEMEFVAMKAELHQTKQLVLTQNEKKAPGSGGNSNRTKAAPRNDGKYAWKSVAPAQGEPHTKTFEKRDYVYCPHHGDTKWVLKIGQGGKPHVGNCTKAAAAPAGQPTHIALSGVTPPVEETPTPQQRGYAEALASVMNPQEI